MVRVHRLKTAAIDRISEMHGETEVRLQMYLLRDNLKSPEKKEKNYALEDVS